MANVPKIPVCLANDVGTGGKLIAVIGKILKEQPDLNIGESRAPVYIKNGQFVKCDPLSSFLMFTPIWLDYKPAWIESGKEVEWVASDGNYHKAKNPAGSGTGNENLWKLYEHLVNDYNNATDKTVYRDSYIVGGATINISYRKANDGHKICVKSTELDSNLNAVYASDDHGVVWYYTIDTANTSFRLPQSKYGFHGAMNYVKFGQALDHEMFLYFNTGIGQAN